MPSVDEKVGEPVPTDKKYTDIIRSNTEIDKKYLKDTGIPAKIIYYCPDCKKIIKPKRMGKKFQFSCTECKENNVAFGTEASIAKYYKIPESELENKN